MFLNDTQSEVVFNRAMLWAILVRLTENKWLAVVFAACALWCLLTAFMGVDA